jgi:hypothetical protein
MGVTIGYMQDSALREFRKGGLREKMDNLAFWKKILAGRISAYTVGLYFISARLSCFRWW